MGIKGGYDTRSNNITLMEVISMDGLQNGKGQADFFLPPWLMPTMASKRGFIYH